MPVMEILINVLPISVTAAATIVYIILIYKQSKATAGMLKAQITWRLLEEVYKPLLQDLIKLTNPENYEVKIPKFSWQKIKSEHPYLIYLIPKDLRKDLNEFSNEYEEFTKRYRSTIRQLVDVLKNRECVGIPSITVRGCYDLPYETVSLLYFIKNEERLKELMQKCKKGSTIIVNKGGSTTEYNDVKAAVKAVEELIDVAKPIMNKIMLQLKQIISKAKQIHSKVSRETEKKIKEIEKAST